MHEQILLTDRTGPRRQDLAAYEREGGYRALRRALRELAPGQVTAEIERAQLRGRGGARFPTSRKWRIAAAQAMHPKYVIANGGEHEPGSRKDRHLVEHYPHKVLEGLLLAGYATGASKGWVYLIADMTGPLDSMEAAVVELRAAGLLGPDILGTGCSFDIAIHRGPATYVAGEETAVIDAIEGGEGKPREKPPYPGDKGLHGRPTTVNNVETLAHVAWIMRHGAERYRAIGTPHSTGTMLFTLGDEVSRPGIYELPFGSTYRQLIYDHGGGPRDGRAIRAILPAMSCALLGPEHLDTPICYEVLRELGSSPGCGGVHLVLEGDDLLATTLGWAQFFMNEQCGQCSACRMETNQFVHVLKGVAAGTKGDFVGQMEKVAIFTRGRGKCSLIEMAAAPVLSAARRFADEL